MVEGTSLENWRANSTVGSNPTLLVNNIMSSLSFNISKLVALILGSSTLTISVQNPIHSILMLIVSFAFGSCMIISLALEYYALLFFIVYVGAIVVLFLFIIMMLDLKMVNFSMDIANLISSRNL